MAEFEIVFDGELDIRSGEIVSILRGIKKGNSIRASLIQNAKSQKVQRSHIEGVIMTEMPISFVPPVIGKVTGLIDVANNTTIFKIKEVENVAKPKRKKFSRSVEKAIWEKYEHKCVICEKLTEFDEGEIDHITPLAKNGTNDLDNLQWLCFRCNKLKGHTKTNEEVKKLLHHKKE